MRKLLAILLLSPLFGLSQTQNIVHVDRVFAKQDKGDQLEKAIAAHAKKYHSGSWSWRVYEVQTGPDAGALQLNEGPNTWTVLDGRGDLGAEHTADFNNTVATFTIDRGSSGYNKYDADLSTTGLTDYTDKVILQHIYPKPGMVDRVRDMLMRSKKAWQSAKVDIAVYESIISGPPSFTIARRLKNGLKDMEESSGPSFKDSWNKVYGANAYDKYQKDYAEMVESRWSELIVYRPDLSSK